MDNTQLQNEIKALRAEFEQLKSSSTIPLSVDKAFRARFGTFLVGRSTLDFGNVLSSSSETKTITVIGAVNGDAVALGVGNSAQAGSGIFTAWVSAADTVSVKFTNNTGGSLDPGSDLFTVIVYKI